MPKVNFVKMNLDRNIELVRWCFNENDDELISFHSQTVSLFPELKNNSNDVKTIVTKTYKEKEKLLESATINYEKAWSKYNDDFFKILCNYLEINWPSNHNTVIADVGIIPVCPRYLDEFSFSVFEGMNNDQIIEICAHELCHFLWFNKWKEVFPDYSRKDFESPSIIWEYSEMVVDPILNSPEFVNIFGKKTRYAYNSFYEEDGLMEGLFEIYNENIPIEEKIKKGFEYVKDRKEKKENNR